MINIKTFFKYSIYIGHNASTSVMLSSWFFYKLRKRIWIINIYKTIIFLKLIFKFLKFLATHNLPFWFINLELSKEFIFKKKALECGEFSCTRLWIRGFLSNYKSIQKSICKYILKRYYIKLDEKKELIYNWNMTRFSWPRGIFLSNIPLNYVICKEAGNIGLPVVAMVDTNVKSFLFNYPIPSNDEALDSVCFITSLISNKLLLFKFKKVILWYNKYKYKKQNLMKMFKQIIKIKKHKKSVNKNSVKHFRRYFYLKLFYSKKWSHFFVTKFFSNFLKFNKNVKNLTKSFYGGYKILNNNQFRYDINVEDVVFSRKLKFFRKVNSCGAIYKRFLKRFHYKLSRDPLQSLKNTIKLKYLKYKKKKSLRYKSIKKFYLNFFFSANIIRQIRIFHESFFINKPSNYIFIRAFHKYQVRPRPYFNQYYTNNKYNQWHFYKGYRYKLDKWAKNKWLNNRFNSRFKNKELHKISNFNDSAIVLNTDRWVTSFKRLFVMQKWRRTVLNYWLFPFIKKYAIKEKGFRWYHSKFFYKEDVIFRKHFNWRLPKVQTPLTTLNFYNNWFLFLFKKQIKRKRLKKKFKRYRFIGRRKLMKKNEFKFKF